MYEMKSKVRFTSTETALVGVFSAMWVILNLTLGPLSFRLLGLPILHDFAAFFTLLLVVWATGKFGTASLVGIIGSPIAILLGGPLLIVGFAASAVLFDVLMSVNHHKLSLRPYNLATAALATSASAYFTGVLIGVFFMNGSIVWALTFWGGWHLVGGIMTAAVTLPLVGILERANVRKITSAG
jgi:hypothetical protein